MSMKMQTYLYIGNNKELRDTSAKEHALKFSSSFDTHIYESSEEGGIEVVRDIQQKLSLLPVNSELTSVVVLDAHLLTMSAQNAFLKTLEEPPAKSQIILTTANPDSLIPTLVSRALKINLGGEQNSDPKIHQDFINNIGSLDLHSRLKVIEDIEIEEWIVSLGYSLREALSNNDLTKAAKVSKLITRAFNSIKLSSVNVNKKIVKQNLVLD